jgi:hypothetical protein
MVQKKKRRLCSGRQAVRRERSTCRDKQHSFPPASPPPRQRAEQKQNPRPLRRQTLSWPLYISLTLPCPFPSPASLPSEFIIHATVLFFIAKCLNQTPYDRRGCKLKVFIIIWPPLCSSVQSSWLQIQRSVFDSRRYHTFWQVAGLERGPLSLMNTTEELLGRKSSGSGLEIRENGRRDPLHWQRGTCIRKSRH